MTSTSLSPQEQLAEVSGALATSPDPTYVPLQPWESAFAEWLSSQPDRPSVQVQRKVASQLSRQLVTPKALGKLKRQNAFVKYFTTLQLDALRRARAILEEHYSEGVHAHIDGMRMAVEEKDYKALPSFTVPILDRVVPKKETAPLATQINVVLTSKQASLMDVAAPEVEYEILGPEAIKL